MVTEQRRTILVAAILTALGAAAFGGRILSGRYRAAAADKNLWRLRYEIDFRADKSGGRIRAALPDNYGGARIQNESFLRSGLAMDVVRNPRTGGRTIIALVPKNAQEGRLSAELDIELGASSHASGWGKRALSAEDRQYYLREEKGVQVSAEAVRAALKEISKGRNTERKLLQGIYDYCRLSVVRGEAAGGVSDAGGALAGKGATDLGRSAAMVALCRAGGVPARLVSGFVLQTRRDAKSHVWVEAYTGGRWVPYDVQKGHSRVLPDTYLPVRRDGVEIVRWSGPVQAAVRYSTFAIRQGAAAQQLRKATPADMLDLTRLPVSMQRTLEILLLLPAGALITAVFRNIIGVNSFGTFTPSLLAMSLLFADFITGLVTFVVVLGIGLGGRGLLDRLKLLMVPRLSIMLTVIILCLTAAVSVLDYYALTPSVHAVIFPMVIMTMMIERFYITWEDRGVKESLKLLAGTIVIAACCLALLRWRLLGRIALSTPECEMFVAALLLIVGRYSGYRLSELVRFRDLGNSPPGQRSLRGGFLGTGHDGKEDR